MVGELVGVLVLTHGILPEHGVPRISHKVAGQTQAASAPSRRRRLADIPKIVSTVCSRLVTSVVDNDD